MKSIKILGIIFVLMIAIFMTSCGMPSIAELKNQDMINKKVSIKGTVEGSFKLGELSGYTVSDNTGSIFVASQDLPANDKTVLIRGTVKKTVLGYYLEE